MVEEAELVTVYVASGHPEAYVIRGHLESEGIPAILGYESVGLVYGFTVDGLGQVEVRVPIALAQQARDILAAGEGESTKSPDQAPNREL